MENENTKAVAKEATVSIVLGIASYIVMLFIGVLASEARY